MDQKVTTSTSTTTTATAAASFELCLSCQFSRAFCRFIWDPISEV